MYPTFTRMPEGYYNLKFVNTASQRAKIMRTRKRVLFSFAFVVFLYSIGLLLVLPNLNFPQGWFYSRLRLVPTAIRILLCLCPIIGVILHCFELEKLKRAGVRVFYLSNGWSLWVLFLFFIGIFYVFRERYYTGDYINYIFLKYHELDIIRWEYFWHVALNNVIQSVWYVLIGKSLGLSTFQSVALVNSIAGSAFLIAILKLSNEFFTSQPENKLLFFLSIVGSGLILICFGHIESYTLLLSAVSWHLYFVVRLLHNHNKNVFLMALVTLALSICIHPSSAILIVSWLTTELVFRRRLATKRIAIACFFLTVWFLLFYFVLRYVGGAPPLKVGLNRFGEHTHIFLSPFRALSLNRLIELLPMILIYFPFIPFLGVFLVPLRINCDTCLFYTFLNFILGVMCIFFIHNKMPMWKDWDLYAFPALLVMIFVGKSILSRARSFTRELYAIIIAGNIGVTIALLYQNLIRDTEQMLFIIRKGIIHF